MVLFLHIAFWLLFFGYKFLDLQPRLGTAHALLLMGLPGCFNLAATYVHYFGLLPQLLRQRYIHYTGGLIALFAIMVPARGWLEAQYLDGIFNSAYYTTWTLNRIISMIWNMASFMLFIALLKFTIDRFELAGRQKALENEKLNAELNYLKAQINPHFLFNTLHNLNYLAEQKSDQATNVIVKLSYIMRYMIYEANKPTVRLQQEINYIRDYLDLESIRLNQGFDLHFSTEKADMNTETAPLLIIPLVENAFKHGISDQQEDNWLYIKIENENQRLKVQVSNSLKPAALRNQAPSGLGLDNLRRRLELSYPGQHRLNIQSSATDFSAALTLDLS
jgi:LytS/YehU family sensor histidine kinase